MVLTHPERIDEGLSARRQSVMRPVAKQTEVPVSPLYSARGADVQKAASQLAKPGILGVVIVGDAGVGKSALANVVAGILALDHHIVRLRSSVAEVPGPYACWNPLLARLPARVMDSPTAVVQALARLLERDAKNSPVVFVLENAELLDEQSTGVLVQLILMRKAKVIAICRHAGDLPPDFNWMLGDGQLSEIALSNYSQEQTTATLKALLGGSVAGSCSAVLHQMSGGNALLLESLVQEQKRVGNLRCQEGFWVLMDKVSYVSGSRFEDHYRAVWAAQGPEERSVIELLSVAQRIRLPVLAACASVEALIHLEEDGIVMVDASAPRWVNLREPYFAAVVRHSMTPQRSRALYLEMNQNITEHGLGPRDEDRELHNDSLWALECGIEVDARSLIKAGWAALRQYENGAAERLASGVTRTDGMWQSAQLIRAMAKLQDSAPLGALDVLRQAGGLTAYADPVEVALFVTIQARSLRLSRADSAVIEQLRRGRARLAAMDNASAESMTRAREILTVVELDCAIFQGAFTEVLPLAQAGYSDVQASREFRIACGARLMEAYAVTGREVDACELGESLWQVLAEDSSPAVTEAVTDTLYRVLLLSGKWTEAISVMHQVQDRTAACADVRGPVCELAIGVAYVYAGRGNMAIEPLRSALAQMKVRASDGSALVADAALAFAYAQVSNNAMARAHLAKAELESRDFLRWSEKIVVEFCTAMARRWLGDPTGKEQLVSASAREAQHGRFTTAGISLFGATIPGTDEEFALLEAIAEKRQGYLAQISELTGRGCRTHSAQLLMQAADLAAQLCLDAVESRCVRYALEFAERGGNSNILTTVQARANRLETDVPGVPIPSTPATKALTFREREIVRLAGKGLANRAIAAQLHVSIRTVEGHLYQAFAILQVTTRGELNGLL